FAERLARAEHARRPIDLRIERAKQTEHRPAYCLREKTAQCFFAAMERRTAHRKCRVATRQYRFRDLSSSRRAAARHSVGLPARHRAARRISDLRTRW